MAHHEFTYEDWRRVPDRHEYALWLPWFRDGEYLGVVTASMSGQEIHAQNNAGITTERLKQALATWVVGELQREVEAGRDSTHPVDEPYVFNVDVLAIERLAASGSHLPELIEGEVVGSFDVWQEADEQPDSGDRAQ